MSSVTSFTISTCILVGIFASLFIISVHADNEADVYPNREIKSGDSNKRPNSFYVGSRYGRSKPYSELADNHNLKMQQRNDRFFLGSRYGKRSSPASIMNLQQQDSYLNCVYTGISDLFRCQDRLDETQETDN